MDKKIFVVGAPRSGTSYLARALSLADDVAFFEESGAFYPFGRRQFTTYYSDVLSQESVFRLNPLEHRFFRFTDQLRRLDRLEKLVHRMLLHTKLGAFDLSPSRELIEVQQCRLDAQDLVLKNELVKKYRNRIQDSTVGDAPTHALFAALFGDFIRLSGKKHLLEKTPDHIAFIPVIRAIFPGAKIMLIRRDKKDAISSFVKHFNARTTLRNRFLTDRMLLKKQCRICRYYEEIESWLVGQPWCHKIEYGQMVEKPLETVCNAVAWAGLALNLKQHAPLFVPGAASSSWDQLSAEQQILVAKTLHSRC